jgi:hypothetical protein
LQTLLGKFIGEIGQIKNRPGKEYRYLMLLFQSHVGLYVIDIGRGVSPGPRNSMNPNVPENIRRLFIFGAVWVRFSIGQICAGPN